MYLLHCSVLWMLCNKLGYLKWQKWLKKCEYQKTREEKELVGENKWNGLGQCLHTLHTRLTIIQGEKYSMSDHHYLVLIIRIMHHQHNERMGETLKSTSSSSRSWRKGGRVATPMRALVVALSPVTLANGSRHCTMHTTHNTQHNTLHTAQCTMHMLHIANGSRPGIAHKLHTVFTIFGVYRVLLPVFEEHMVQFSACT